MIYIGYGIGQYYNVVKQDLDEAGIKLSFLCDRKWDETSELSYDGIPIIRREELSKMPDVVCVIFSLNHIVTNSIVEDLRKAGMSYIHVDELLKHKESKVVTGKQLKESCETGVYTDSRNNKIYFDQSIPENIKISFKGRNNTLTLGKNLLIGNFKVVFGNDGICSIGDDTEIIDAIFFVAYAKLSIGRDCLFGSGITLRTHDGHHIFDLNTHKRINVPKDIIIGDHVWLAKDVTLLPGASIGTGTVVGANALTSSQFPEHCIIAGVPAKVIRENICWSKDETSVSNNEFLEECNSRVARNYIGEEL